MPTQRKYGSAAERQAAYRLRCKKSSTVMLGVPPTPGYRRWETMRKQALSLVEQIACEMEAYYEERSERWQDSERGESFLEVMESMSETADLLRDTPSLHSNEPGPSVKHNVTLRAAGVDRAGGHPTDMARKGVAY